MKAKPKPKPKRRPRREPAPLPPGVNALLGREQICAALGISPRSLDTMLSSGRFPRADFRVGQFPRWTVETFNAWVESQARKKA